LLDHFIKKYARAMNKRFTSVSRAALDILMSYSWPGNVRELENAVERAMVIGREPEIQVSDFPLQMGSTQQPELRLSLDEVERAHILHVLEFCDWNQTRAAKILAIDRVTLYNKIKKYGFRKGMSAAS
jgi:DNA-binding NtrC family response regulator